MLPSSHTAVSSHNGVFSWCWRKGIQQGKREFCGAVALQVLENRLYSVSKTCIFQRSSGRGPQKSVKSFFLKLLNTIHRFPINSTFSEIFIGQSPICRAKSCSKYFYTVVILLNIDKPQWRLVTFLLGGQKPK